MSFFEPRTEHLSYLFSALDSLTSVDGGMTLELVFMVFIVFVLFNHHDASGRH